MATHTKDVLAQALRQAGLIDMARLAAEGYYHDYLSPLAQPGLQLVADLRKVRTPQAEALRLRVLEGDFDASISESEEWMDSPAGKAAFAGLGRPKT